MKDIFYYLIIVAVVILSLTITARADVETLIRKTAIEEGIDPDLAVAIARVESGLDNRTIGKLGEVGVYQLRPEYHHVRNGDLRSNVRTGIRYLRYVKEQCQPRYGSAWFICYNLGPNHQVKHPTKFPYYVRVKAAMNENHCDDLIRYQNRMLTEQSEQIETLRAENADLKNSLLEAHRIYQDAKTKCLNGI